MPNTEINAHFQLKRNILTKDTYKNTNLKTKIMKLFRKTTENIERAERNIENCNKLKAKMDADIKKWADIIKQDMKNLNKI